MATTYVIAGPPGIGKSTYGHFFVKPQVELLNHDHVTQLYRNRGDIDYQKLASRKANAFVEDKLEGHTDFGIELNLGFDNHYNLLRGLRQRNPYQTIQVILFYTDDLQLCLDRAKAREEAGGHAVAESVIREMYRNTFSLLQENSQLIDRLQLVNVTSDTFELIYSRRLPKVKPEFIHTVLPEWFAIHFQEFGR